MCSYEKSEFAHFEHIVLWLESMGVDSGEGLGAILEHHPHILWTEIELLDSMAYWYLIANSKVI